MIKKEKKNFKGKYSLAKAIEVNKRIKNPELFPKIQPVNTELSNAKIEEGLQPEPCKYLP